MPYTEKQLIAALKRIEKNWPKGYTLFSWSGSYHDASVATFPGIPNDGGDPD